MQNPHNTGSSFQGNRNLALEDNELESEYSQCMEQEHPKTPACHLVKSENLSR